MNKFIFYVLSSIAVVFFILWNIANYTDLDLSKIGLSTRIEETKYRHSAGGLVTTKRKKVVITIQEPSWNTQIKNEVAK